MPRGIAVPQQLQEGASLPERKRSHDDLDEAEATVTPSKRRRDSTREAVAANGPEDSDDHGLNGAESEVAAGDEPTDALEENTEEPPPKTTPRRGRPPKASLNGDTPTPKTKRTSIFETPQKPTTPNGITKHGQAADQSARRKSARALIEHVVGDKTSDDEQDDGLAREIYESDEGEDENDDDDDEDEAAAEGNGLGLDTEDLDPEATPSKTPKRRGRPKKLKSPTPPRDLPPHELYFAHNKPGRPKTSNNTLGSLALLTHEEYFAIVGDQQERHSGDIAYLESLHAESFPQWVFELSQGFSVCLYGFGSKRALLRKFATHLYSKSQDHKSHQVIMVNGYAPTTTMREILSSIRNAIDPEVPTSQPTTMVQNLTSSLSTSGMSLTVVVNSIDAAPLRKTSSQTILAQLAAHPQVQFVCSADTPDFSLLWDIGLRSAFNFVFHDCTTFAPFAAELDVVDEVQELLGLKTGRVNGKEGVAFVLRSLPENAKKLFELMIGEVLIAMEEEGNFADESTGVEYRMLYNKAVEEFICSSEMAFRTLLKEFHDHQIIESRKDNLGTELLSLPFRREELEAILEDLMS